MQQLYSVVFHICMLSAPATCIDNSSTQMVPKGQCGLTSAITYPFDGKTPVDATQELRCVRKDLHAPGGP